MLLFYDSVFAYGNGWMKQKTQCGVLSSNQNMVFK